jgi:two-component system sensor histidine kinase AlgZ
VATQEEILNVPPRIWRRALLLAWLAYWLMGVVCSLPLDNVRELIRFRTSLAIAESGAALLLWAFCKWLWNRDWKWTSRIAIAGVTSFVLGYICSVGSEWVVPWGNPEIHNLRSSLLLGTYASVLTGFPLLACTGVYFAAWQWQAARERETHLLRAETLAREAELRALRSELTPHFLFNTMNGISTLIGEGHAGEARRMIARLGDFLRATLESIGKNEIPLEQEIHYVQDYVAIEQIRLGDRLRQHVMLDPFAANALVPTLLLQPLIENAIQHGIAATSAEGELTLHTKKRGMRLQIVIANSVDPAATTRGRGKGLGLQNSRERLSAMYAGEAALTIRESPDRWQVVIDLPFRASESLARASSKIVA